MSEIFMGGMARDYYGMDEYYFTRCQVHGLIFGNEDGECVLCLISRLRAEVEQLKNKLKEIEATFGDN